MSPGWVYNRMKTLLRRAGLLSIRFHDLRHTFATTALGNGMDVKTLSAMLGHVSAATTLDNYSHTTDAMQAAAAANMGDRESGQRGAKEGNLPDRKTGFPALHAVPQEDQKAGDRLYQPGQRTLLGRAVFPHVARREETLPKHLRQDP